MSKIQFWITYHWSRSWSVRRPCLIRSWRFAFSTSDFETKRTETVLTTATNMLLCEDLDEWFLSWIWGAKRQRAKGLSFGIQQVRRLDSATKVRLLVLLGSKLSTQSAGIWMTFTTSTRRSMLPCGGRLPLVWNCLQQVLAQRWQVSWRISHFLGKLDTGNMSDHVW